MNIFPLSNANLLQLSENGVYIFQDQSIAYTEGSKAEDYLRQVFHKSKDLSSQSVELERAIQDWSSEYHLTSVRANILRCLDLSEVKNALELGCGCGSITRYLGETGMQVDAIEGGAGRAELARLRCRDLENVNIVQANFQELQLPEQSYDAVFLIGVIEYAAMFSPDQKNDRAAITDIFSRVRASLKPGGILVLALENRMGLKYLFGAGEDHLVKPYLGIYDYPGKTGVRSYSRQEWRDILCHNNMEHFTFLFPFPDYKLPRVVLGEEYVKHDPYAYSLLYRIDSRDYLSSWRTEANEFLSWKGVQRAGLLPELANSFLIVASREKKSVEKVANKDFIHFSSSGRRPDFRTYTQKTVGSERVVKKKVTGNVVKGSELCQQLEESPFYQGELLITSWIESLVSDEPLKELTLLLKDYYSFLQKNCQTKENTQHLVELLPSNIIVDTKTGSWMPFDQEWIAKDPVSADFVYFRALFWFALHNRETIAAAFDNHFKVVEDFVSFFFTRLGVGYKNKRPSFITSEENLHVDVTAGMGQEIDVSYMLAMTLFDEICNKSEEKRERGEPIKGNQKNSTNIFALAKKSAKLLQSYLLSSHCRIIRKSGIFDPDFYRASDKALQEPSVEPLLHYVTTGFKEGRDPSPLFSLDHYHRLYPHLKSKGLDPLLHYLEEGVKEGATTHPLLREYILNPGTYGKKPELIKREKNQETSPHNVSYFDAEYYCRRYPDIGKSDFLPVEHYLNHGGKERRQPGPFFDPQWYTDRTPFYNQEEDDLFTHYLKTGATVGKSPVPVFDPQYYREQNKELHNTISDVFGHYLQYGIQVDKKPCSWFDPEYYRSPSSDFSPYSYPLDHYLYHGVHERRYVNEKVAKLSQKPHISVLVPVYNVKKSYLNCCIRSVLFQSYPHWDLCLVNDGSSEAHIQPLMQQWADKDERIRIQSLKRNQGIAFASNAAAEMSTGEFLLFLDNDDELHPEALFYMVDRICATGADLLYSDEDLIGDDGRRLSVFHKPDFNRKLLCNHNYVTHPVVTCRKLFTKVGGFSPILSGAQDYDLFLKLSERAKKVEHVPKILYHWRASESSTSINHGQKEYADAAGKNALRAMLDRLGQQGDVISTDWKYYYRVKKEVSNTEKISVVILGKNYTEFTQWLEDLLVFCTYPYLEFLVCLEKEECNQMQEQVTGTDHFSRIQFLQVSSIKDPAKCYNKAVESCSGTHVVFLAPYVMPVAEEWIEALLEYSQDSKCGIIGGKITKSQEEANFTVPDVSQTSPTYYAEFLQKCSTHLNGLQCVQNVWMVSHNLAMIEKSVFQAVSGFDEKVCSRLFIDSDISLRLVKKGFSNVYTPYASAQWLSDAEDTYTVSFEEDGQEEEQGDFQKRWHELLKKGDPYYNLGVAEEAGVDKKTFIKWYTGNEKKNS